MAIEQALPMDSVFTTQEWFANWLSAFGGPHAGVWRPRDGRPDLGIPYTIGRRRVGPAAFRTADAAANSHTPRYDVLGELNDPCSTLTSMMRELRVTAIRFSPISEQSRLAEGMRTGPIGLRCQRTIAETAPFVECHASWEAYWNGRGRKTREDWARHERRLVKDGASLVLVREWTEAERLLPVIFAIEASGWKGRGGSAIEQRPETAAFYSRLVRDWAEAGCLRLFLLRVRDQFIAFQLCALRHGVLTSLKIGYLSEYAAKSPGQVLQLLIVRWAFDQPDVTRFDLCGPATETKRRWATAEEPLWALSVFAPSSTGWAAWLCETKLRQVWHRVRSIRRSAPVLTRLRAP